MATSGSYNYSVTAANIITAALESIGVLAAGATTATADSDTALRRLNFIAKQYQGTADGSPGMKVHLRKRVFLFPQKGQQEYLIGPGSSDARSTTTFGRTTIDAAEAIGQTVISVTATSDTTTFPGTTLTMTASDIIGIEQDDGTIHWSTVSSISAGDTVTIGAAITVAASVGNYVYWFTSRAQRFTNIESASLRDSSYNDTPLNVYVDRRQYDLGVADKFADGDPASILVEPTLTQTRVTLDSQWNDPSKFIVLNVLYPSEDYDATTDDIAYPQEAFRFLMWELAFDLCPTYGLPWTPNMEQNRQEARQMYLNLNPENSVLYFRPN